MITTNSGTSIDEPDHDWAALLTDAALEAAESYRKSSRTQMVTILMGDQVGSTQRGRAISNVEGIALRDRFRTLYRAQVARFDGEHVEYAGDSVLAVFASPTQATLCALHLQHALASQGDLPPLRMGLHLGEIVVRSEGIREVYGRQVNVCARVMDLADGSQTLLLQSVFENAQANISPRETNELGELAWKDYGPYRFKGTETQAFRVCEVGEVGLAPLTRPTGSAKGWPADRDEELEWRPAKGMKVPNSSYVLIKKLGVGEFGEVWLGRQEGDNVEHAVKFCFDRARVNFLKREARTLLELNARLPRQEGLVQYIPASLDVGTERPPYFLAEEYVEGPTLAQWLEGNPPLAARLDVVAQVANALDAIHRVGILHQDVKPSNILLQACPDDRVQAKLCDFGLAVTRDATLLERLRSAALSQLPVGGGTPNYMAPELFDDPRSASAASDVYSLGVTLYQVVAGDLRKRFLPGWEADIASPVLQATIRSCTERSPEARQSHAGEIANELRTFEQRVAQAKAEEDAKEQRRRAEQTAALARVRRTRLVAVTVSGVVISVLLTLYAISETQRASIEADLRSEADTRSQEAHRERERAEENLQIARGAVDEFLVKMGRSSLVYDPSYAPLRTSLIKSSLQYHQQFVDAYHDVSALRGDMAWTYFTMAAMLMQLEDATWFDAYADGLELLAEILRTETRPEDLGRMTEGVWHAGATGGPNAINSIRMDPKRAFELGQRAIELTESLAAKYPEIRAIRNDLAFEYHHLGHMVEAVSREKAKAAHRRALEVWSGLLEEDSESIDYIYGAAISLDRIGSLHDLAGNTTEALGHLERARSMYERVLSHSPGVPQFCETYAGFLNNYGQALANSGQMEKGIEAFDTGSARLEELMATYPSLKNFHPLAADIAYRRGRTQQRLGRCDAAVDDFKRAGELSADSLEKVTLALAEGVAGNCANPELALATAADATESRSEASASWRALAAVRLMRKEFEPALEALMRATMLDPNGPAHAQDLFRAARCQVELGSLEKARELHDQAVVTMDALAPGADDSLQALKAESSALLAR